MGFIEAIKTCFGKYATFEGRARRSEYWFWTLFCVIVGCLLGQIPVLGWLINIALLLPGIAVAVRRMHDIGKSGWLVILSIIPIANFVFLYFCVLDSQPGENEYGKNPKEIA